MKHKYMILFGFVGFALFLVFFVVAVESMEEGTKEVKCYDKFGNEIKGVVCLSEPLTKEGLGLTACAGILILVTVTILGGLFDQFVEEN